MPDKPLPAPEGPDENRRRVARERAQEGGPKASNRSGDFKQAKASKAAKRSMWQGAEEDRHE